MQKNNLYHRIKKKFSIVLMLIRSSIFQFQLSINQN